ncbi:uncharacterized protein LOC123671750 isoform X3 [Harmonia axyridis]|nr:uncharacterized protein LOC123671750 isoform X2 [Harmonia axyridis]XP_045461726.1 uncharacterized protein LOC123671750 isoform X3 [Harmonia axyridis]
MESVPEAQKTKKSKNRNSPIKRKLDVLEDLDEYKVKYNKHHVIFGKYATKMTAEQFFRFFAQCQSPCKKTKAFRFLMRTFFNDETLASRSLSGAASNAYRTLPPKPPLDIKIITDVYYLAKKFLKFDTHMFCRLVTGLCADSVKLLKKRKKKNVKKQD